MLVQPYPFASEVYKMFATQVFSNLEYYKYYWMYGYPFYPEITNNECDKITRISMNGDRILGYMNVDIDRSLWCVENISIISFQQKPSYMFAKDAKKFISDLFYFYNFDNITWEYLDKNPNAELYKRFVKHLGGTIINVGKSNTLNNEICNKMRAVIGDHHGGIPEEHLLWPKRKG